MLGTVNFYDRIKRFGFIVPDDPTLPDHFVVPKFMLGDKHQLFLMEGWKVEFDSVDSDGKPQAHNVRIVSRTIAIQRSAPVTPEASR
jgi:cold shock CspA family protein